LCDFNNFCFLSEGPKGYKYPIAILIDRYSLSADEELVASLKDHPNVRLVGQNTAGTYHCGNAHPLLLPNSKITIKISTMFRKSRDGKFIERVGFSPDLKLEDGTDAFRYVKKNWENLKS
jgi:C-terminal processing protease CtpA/Prc